MKQLAGSNIAVPLSDDLVSEWLVVSQTASNSWEGFEYYEYQHPTPYTQLRTINLRMLDHANNAAGELYLIGFEGRNIPQPEEGPDELETIFKGLSKNWKNATGSFSLNMRRYTHPTYQVLMHALEKENKDQVLSLILRELKERPDVWFEALKKFSGANPAANADTFTDAVEAWLVWGKLKKYI